MLEAAAACVGGRALNSREQATCTGCMDLQAFLLSTGPNASNISDGQENLTLAGELKSSLLRDGCGKWEGFTSGAKLPRKLYLTVLGGKICSLLCLEGKRRGGDTS